MTGLGSVGADEGALLIAVHNIVRNLTVEEDDGDTGGLSGLNSVLSGNMVELIICNNDGMAEGAVSALQGAGYNTGDGKTIPVFGVDATDSAKQLINEGKMTGTIKQDAEGMASTILNLVSSVQGGGELMDNTSSFNVDEGVAKIRVPYATYTGE